MPRCVGLMPGGKEELERCCLTCAPSTALQLLPSLQALLHVPLLVHGSILLHHPLLLLPLLRGHYCPVRCPPLDGPCLGCSTSRCLPGGCSFRSWPPGMPHPMSSTGRFLHGMFQWLSTSRCLSGGCSFRSLSPGCPVRCPPLDCPCLGCSTG